MSESENLENLVAEARHREFPASIYAAREAIDILSDRGEEESELYNELTDIWIDLIRGELRRLLEDSIASGRRHWRQIEDFLEEWKDLVDLEVDLDSVASSMGEEYNRLVFRVFPAKQAAEFFRRDLGVEEFRQLAQEAAQTGDREDIEYLLSLASADFILKEESPDAVAALRQRLHEMKRPS